MRLSWVAGDEVLFSASCSGRLIAYFMFLLAFVPESGKYRLLAGPARTDSVLTVFCIIV